MLWTILDPRAFLTGTVEIGYELLRINIGPTPGCPGDGLPNLLGIIADKEVFVCLLRCDFSKPGRSDQRVEILALDADTSRPHAVGMQSPLLQPALDGDHANFQQSGRISNSEKPVFRTHHHLIDSRRLPE